MFGRAVPAAKQWLSTISQQVVERAYAGLPLRRLEGVALWRVGVRCR